MRLYGLIGYPLSHSFSKKYFSEKFEKENIHHCEYHLFPIEKVFEIKDLLQKHPTLKGLNVTIPHKMEVMPLLHQISAEAKAIGAVNCIKIKENKDLEGFNTDVYGFRESLKSLLKPQHQRALVLGNGGAAKAVFYALQQLGIGYQIVSRKSSADAISYAQITEELMENHTLIINTTPLGMAPNIDQCPQIPYEKMSARHLAYDLVYNPAETEFLRRSAAQGAMIKNGLEMLHLQAEKAWEIWNT